MSRKQTFFMDLRRCTGCKTCSVACNIENDLPEGVRHTEIITVGGPAADLPLMESAGHALCYVPIMSTRCTTCAHRTSEGLVPFCVRTCPMKARVFGDLSNPESEVYKKMEQARERGRRIFTLPKSLKTKRDVYYAL